MCIFGALNTLSTVFMTVFVFSLTSQGHTMLIQCEVDECCPEGQFCYKETGICASCINCTAYRRKLSSWTQCPKKALDCGDCIEGFESETLSDGRKQDSCKIIKKTHKDSNVVPYIDRTLATYGIVTISLIVILISIVFFCIRYKFKKRSIRQSDLTDPETVPFSCNDTPPPYYPTVTQEAQEQPSAPYSTEVTFDHAVECSAEILVKAVPFCPPNYINVLGCNTQPPENENESAEDFEVLDESTQPSDWTPNPPNFITDKSLPESPSSSSEVAERPFQHLNRRDSGASSTLSLASTTNSSSKKDNDTGYDSNSDEGPRNKRARLLGDVTVINSTSITQNQNSSNILTISQDAEELQ